MAGRKQGSKNLYKSDGKIVNQYKVEFTEEDKKALVSLVNSANRKRKRMLEEEGELERKEAGKKTGQKIGQTTQKMGKESDFILTKKTKSLQRFKSRQDFENYIDNLKNVVDRDYIPKRVKQYKENDIKALRNVYGKSADPIIEKIKSMTDKEYMRLVQADEVGEISYKYTETDKKAGLRRIKKAYGLPTGSKRKKG